MLSAPALNHAAQITTKNCTRAVSGEGMPTCSSSTQCTQVEHLFPESPGREKFGDAPLRPQPLSSAVLACPFTGGPQGPRDVPHQHQVACGCRSGKPG